MTPPTSKTTPTNGWRQHKAKLFALLFWVSTVALYYAYTRQNNLTLTDSITQLATIFTQTLYGPLLYILLYTLRPILFIPSTIFTLLGGFFFGTIGILYVVIGSNASALLAFTIGRYFGTGILDNLDQNSIIQQYTQRMRDNSFETILSMRLILLPYDLVNYVAGFLKINWRAFLLATLIGSLPGSSSVVLLGASFGTIDDLLAGDISLNPTTLIISALFIAFGFALSRYLKKREATAQI